MASGGIKPEELMLRDFGEAILCNSLILHKTSQPVVLTAGGVLPVAGLQQLFAASQSFTGLLGALVAARRFLLLGRRRTSLKTSLEGIPVNMGDNLSKEPFSVVYTKPVAKKVDQVPDTASTHPYKPEDFQGTAKEPAKGTCKDFQASADARKRL